MRARIVGLEKVEEGGGIDSSLAYKTCDEKCSNINFAKEPASEMDQVQDSTRCYDF